MNTNVSRSLQIQTDQIFGKYLKDDSINEICFNGNKSLWLQDYKGVWKEDSEINFSYEQMMAFATPLASHKEDILKANKPILSATLNNGERVQVVIPPATKKGKISITIRKPSKVRYKLEDYKKQGMFDSIVHENEKVLSNDERELIKLYENRDWENFLINAVKIGKNIVIAGATGSGKTTFMKSLIDFIPLEERIITIEDTEEISFHEHKNYVQLFYPSEAKEGDPVTSAILLKSCLRMKPDRILLAELRGGEAYDYLSVLNSGHGGSITSVHAGSVSKVFKRLTDMAGKNPSTKNISSKQMKKDFKDVIDIVVHIEAHNGIRKFSDVFYKGAKSG